LLFEEKFQGFTFRSLVGSSFEADTDDVIKSLSGRIKTTSNKKCSQVPLIQIPSPNNHSKHYYQPANNMSEDVSHPTLLLILTYLKRGRQYPAPSQV
jgi:hypothetical protein